MDISLFNLLCFRENSSVLNQLGALSHPFYYLGLVDKNSSPNFCMITGNCIMTFRNLPTKYIDYGGLKADCSVRKMSLELH